MRHFLLSWALAAGVEAGCRRPTTTTGDTTTSQASLSSSSVACATDNTCIAAITNGLPDCSSLLQVTVTPPTATVYATATITDATTTATVATETDTVTATVSTETDILTVSAVAQKRDITVPSIPAYAAACVDFSVYSSACSCLGVEVETVTAFTPVTTLAISEAETETQDVTAFTTVTELATATTQLTSTARPSCTPSALGTQRPGGSCGCTYAYQTCAKVTSSSMSVTTADTEILCAVSCDDDPTCIAFSYDTEGTTCIVIHGQPEFSYVDGWVFGIRPGVPCSNNSCNS